MRASVYSLTFRISQSKRQEGFRKPIALFVDPTILSGAPYTGSGEIGYTPFRKRAVVPSGCLMYKIWQTDDGEKIDIVNIKGLPYEFIRLILHNDYEYREGDNLSYLINMYLYNDRLRAFTQSSIQRVEPNDLPKCENVYYFLDHAANFIQNNLSRNGNIKQEIERYRVVFLYDNVDDYNSYIFARQLIFSQNSASWGTLILQKNPDDDALSPFSDIMHFTRRIDMIPYNYTDNFISSNLPFNSVSLYVDPMLSSNNKIFLKYKTHHGVTSFFQNSLEGLRGNLDFTTINGLTFEEDYLNSIILYLDYNTINDTAGTYDELRLLGFGFVTQSAGKNVLELISNLDPIEGRESITNTDGILYEHTLLTAFLRFIILYKYLDYDILCYITYNENIKEFKNINTVDYVQKSLIYKWSTSIPEAKTKLEEKEEEGFIIIKKNGRILISYNEEPDNYVELSFDTVHELSEIIDSLSRNRIKLVYADKNMKEVIVKYLNDILDNRNAKLVFNVNRYPTYRHDPMYVTNNSGTLGNRRYVEFLSDYYPLYWYYNGTNRVPEVVNLSGSGVSVMDEYFYNLHPCVLVYGNSVRYPATKRQVRVRCVKHLADATPEGNPEEYKYSGVTYIEIQDPVKLNTIIWNRLILTQTDATLPLDLDSITNSQEEIGPPVINLDYMNTSIQNFLDGNLISSRDILEYPIIPDNTTPIAEIDNNAKVYYREVLYWKYLRYLINVGIVRYYFYNLTTWSAPDIVGYRVRAINDTTNTPTTEIALSVLFYDNRIIDTIEIQINIST